MASSADGEVSGHDGVFHDLGAGHEREAPGGSDDLAEAVIGEPVEDEEGPGGDAQVSRLTRREELILATEILDSATPEELSDAGIIASAEDMQVSFSGLLPIPEMYGAYDENTRERICRWNDSFTIDESKRQDKLVEHEIKQARTSQWVSAALILLSWVFAVIMYLISGNAVITGLFVSVSLITALGGLFKPARSKSSRNNKAEESNQD